LLGVFVMGVSVEWRSLSVRGGCVEGRNEIDVVQGGASVVQANYVGQVTMAAPVPERVVPRELPRAAARLVGRDREIRLCVEGSAPLFVLDGLTGVGRRAVARYVSRQLAPGFAGGQLYVDLSTVLVDGEQVVSSALRGLLRSVGVDEQVMPPDSELPAWWRSRSAERECLLLVENVTEAEQVLALLPGGEGSVVLAAGRVEAQVRVRAVGGETIKLEPLAPEQAAELFGWLSGMEIDADDEVLAHCGGLPQALEQAANLVLTRRSPTLESLRERLRRSRDELTRVWQGSKKGESVFEATYQSAGREAQRMYRLLGAYPAVGISAETAGVLAALDSVEVSDALAELVSLRILDEEDGQYLLHPLVRDHAQACAARADVDEQHEALRRVVREFRDVAYHADVAVLGNRFRVAAPPVTADPFSGTKEERNAAALAWFELHRRTLHEMQAIAMEVGPPDAAWQLAESLTAYYFNRKRHADSLQVALHGAEAARAAGNAVAEARLSSVASRPLSDLERFAEAEELVNRSIELADREGPLVLQASVREFQGRYLDKSGQPEAAQAAYRRSIELNEQAGERRGVALARMFLGDSLADEAGLGELETAHQWFAANDDPRMAARALLAIGKLRLKLSQPQGLEAVEEAAKVLGGSGLYSYEAEARELLYRELAEREPDRARVHLERAIELYRRLGSLRAGELERSVPDDNRGDGTAKA
jgi:tetratricopeptide (TPR) repeat protein